MRFFNIAGPCRSDEHYMLDPTARLPEADVRRLIDRKLYFVLHAPRQVGKTTAILALSKKLTAEERFASVVLSVESAAPYRDDIDKAEKAILGAWIRQLKVRLPSDLRPKLPTDGIPGTRISEALQQWAQYSPRPLVLFIDEIDTLQNETLISVLRQIRDGYADRPENFPWSIGLVGMRDVRDYKVASGGSERLTTSSPFNIKTESLTLRNFTSVEVAELYRQHTQTTGQEFTGEAITYAFELTQGQPWLVNALALEATLKLAPQVNTPITKDIIDRARENLIQRQETHLDSLTERLSEPRTRNVIGAILAGTTFPDIPNDDLRFVMDLGLIRYDERGNVVIANPIYRDVIPYALTNITRGSINLPKPTWLTADGKLDPDRLLEGFLAFWRQNGEPLLRNVHYHEIAPHIVLMAYLHRVVNGGGFIEREYAIGSRFMDLCVRYGPRSTGQVLAMELKVQRDTGPDALTEGLAQLDAYLAGLSLDTGWLVIFDQRSGIPPIAERTRTEPATTPAGRSVTVVWA
jgi:hypothetical protein